MERESVQYVPEFEMGYCLFNQLSIFCSSHSGGGFSCPEPFASSTSAVRRRAANWAASAGGAKLSYSPTIRSTGLVMLPAFDRMTSPPASIMSLQAATTL